MHYKGVENSAMASVSPQSGILMNSQYIGRYRFFAGRAAEYADDSTPPYVVPFTISILASQSLFLNEYYSPAAALIIPIYRVEVPYAYLMVIIMQAVTALLVKWAYTPTPFYIPLLGGQQAVPDFETLKYITSLTNSQGNSFGFNGNTRSNRTLRLNNSVSQLEVPSTPLFPEGIALNLSFMSPFSAPTSRASTLFSIKLTLIKNNRGYLIPLLTLILYIILKPLIINKTYNDQNNKRSK